MKICTCRSSYSRTTGELLDREISDIREVEGEDFYRPLVEILGEKFIREELMKKEVKL